MDVTKATEPHESDVVIDYAKDDEGTWRLPRTPRWPSWTPCCSDCSRLCVSLFGADGNVTSDCPLI